MSISVKAKIIRVINVNAGATTFAWEKLGKILSPDPAYPWMSTCAGPSFALPAGDGSRCDIYVTGRDERNRSHIGVVTLDLRHPEKILKIRSEAVLSPGSLGAFDENGVSYPYLVAHEGRFWMFYVGWMPTVLTPYQTHLGLAVSQPDGSFKRVSRAPILERTDEDPLAMGSACVLKDGEKFRMWYTSYTGWGATSKDPKHTYLIKYAESSNLTGWTRPGKISIPIANPGEFAICRPSVVRWGDLYHMWYAVRGKEYRIGYAYSTDAIHWTRRDELAGIAPSGEGWDSRAVTYPHVFECAGDHYMLYNGNDYGKQGLGLARLRA